MQPMIWLAAASQTEPSVEDVIDTAEQVTTDTVQEVNQFIKFFNDRIPDLIAFGIQVVLAIIVFIIGSKLIKWVRRIVKRSLEPGSASSLTPC